MSPLSQAILFVANTLGSLVLMVVFLRFLLQLVRADFYNPISQFIVRFTNPMLIPLRKVIPGFGGLDWASLVLALLLQFALIALLLFIVPNQISYTWPQVLGWSAIGLVKLVFNIYFYGIIILAIASWFAPNSYNPVLILINQLIEPLVAPVRRMMPDLGGIDLSPMLVLIAIKVFEILLLIPVASALSLPRGIVMGY